MLSSLTGASCELYRRGFQVFDGLPSEEKKYWHSHKYEVAEPPAIP